MQFGIGMYLWTTNVTSDHYGHFAELRALGYDGVEVPVSSANTTDWKELRSVLDDLGLSCTAIINVGPDKDTASADKKIRTRGLHELTFGIEICESLGASVMCGPVQSAYGRFTGNGPTGEELGWSAETMRAAAEVAAQYGVVLAAEFLNRHESYFLNTLGAGASLTRRVDHPNFGVLYDTHHAHAEEDDVALAIREHGWCIRHVQFSENNRGSLGLGQVNWDATVSALKEMGYDGWVAAEAFAADVDGLSSAAHVWRNTFESKDSFASGAIQFMQKVMN